MKEYRFRIGQNAYCVTVEGIKDSVASVSVNGVNYQVEMDEAPVTAVPDPQPAGAGAEAAAHTAPQPLTGAPAAGKAVRSPLPGVILSVNVKEGQKVTRGTRIAVLEAMKMENDILAECDCTIGQIKVQKGDSILEGAIICTIG